jgi:nitronate monooxygenase
MMNEATRRLGIRYPIVQGPFGGGISTAQLVAAVSNKGGLGSYGAHLVAPDEIGRVVAEIRALTLKPFAMNLWVSNRDAGTLRIGRSDFERYATLFAPYFEELGSTMPQYPERMLPLFEDQAHALIEAGPPVFSFVFGIPAADILAKCRKRGIATIGAATSIAEAQELESAGVDLIVATGFEAGGHRPSFLKRAEDSLMGTFVLTQLVADRVKVPVIAAGGIVDGRGIRAALTLGAQAAQLGTAFLACAESGTTDRHRGMLFSGRTQSTTLTRAYTGRLARGMPNRLVEVMTAHAGRLPPYPVQAWFVSRLKQAAVEADRADFFSLYAGQAAPNLRHRTASALMGALIDDIENVRTP